jgi:uncharacterized protein
MSTAAKARFVHVEWKNSGTTVRGSALVTKKSAAPWFIFSHGFTGHRLGPGYLFVRLSRALAGAGFSSLRFDFCGSGESDGAFPDMTIDTMKSDLLSAVRLVRRKYSPSSIILIGHSLGGMIACLCCAEARPQGLALLSPVGDPQGLIRRRKAIMDAGPNTNGFFENGPHEMAMAFLDGLKSIDPVATVARQFRGKLLLIQGDNDTSISVNESGQYVRAAQGAGIETRYLILRNADHNYSTVSIFKAICSTVTDWAKERFR